jgi:spore germination cell wall hydrolase CwlJ-like protein
LTVGVGVAGAYVAGRMTAETPRANEAGRLIAISQAPQKLAAAQQSAPAAAPSQLDLALLHAASFQIPAPFRLADPTQSGRDLDCLTAAVYYEARGEAKAGQAAVAQVVLNRVRNRNFPKTVCGVVYQGAASRGCQFSFACDGAAEGRREPGAWDRARSVAARALGGYVMPEVGGATHFHVASLGAIWGGSMVRIAQIGEHVFYAFSGHRAAIARDASQNSAADDAAALDPGPPADGGHVAAAALDKPAVQAVVASPTTTSSSS